MRPHQQQPLLPRLLLLSCRRYHRLLAVQERRGEWRLLPRSRDRRLPDQRSTTGVDNRSSSTMGWAPVLKQRPTKGLRRLHRRRGSEGERAGRLQQQQHLQQQREAVVAGVE